MRLRRTLRKPIPVLALVVVALLGTSASGSSSPWLNLSLEWHVAHAVDIAVVRLIDRQTVTFEYDGRSEVCGYQYIAQVLEPLKGQEVGTFEFFGPGREVFVGLNKDYLVMVFVRDLEQLEAEAAPARPSLEGIHEARSDCHMTAGPRVVLTSPQTMIPFDSGLSDNLGDKWLKLDPAYVSVLEVSSFSLAFIRKEEGLDGETVSLVDWAEAKAVIRDLMFLSAFFGGCDCTQK